MDTDGSLIRGFKCAFVVFEKASGCRAATAALEKNLSVEEPLVLSTPERPVATGLKKWKREYNARYAHQRSYFCHHARLKTTGPLPLPLVLNPPLTRYYPCPNEAYSVLSQSKLALH